MRLDDENILQLLKKGDEAAFEMVFKSFYTRLYAFSNEYVVDSTVAENIVQDAFLVLWNKRTELRANTNLNAYLYTVVKNFCLKYLRQEAVSTTYQKYEKSKKEELNLNRQALNDLEISQLAIKEIEQIIEETLNSLPPRCREVFEMSRFTDMKNREIADKLGITEKAVEANVSRALKALKVSPSRSSLMTGQHTGHTFIRGNKEVQPEGQHPLEAEAYTLAEALQDAGYVTGAFGKWGLGYPGSEGDPNNQGFDEFFGYNCQRLAHHYYPYHLWHNQEKIMLEGNEGFKTEQYGPDVIHEQALKFLENNKDKPFFMFYPSLVPHAEMFAPDGYMEKYRGKFEPENSYEGVDSGENYRKGPYGSQPESHAATVAMINVLDDQVGEIVDKLRELGIYENTLIIFVSDNGPHLEGGANPDYFNSNGPFRGYKRDLYEGGIRVPMIAVWERKITPGTKTDHPSAFWDIYPTFAKITGAKTPDNIDGISFLPTLLGNDDEQEKHEYLYWEFHERGGRQALRKGKWKLVKYNVLNPEKTTTELYNLENDLGEENNMAEQHLEIVGELSEVMKNARTKSEVFTFDSGTYLE